MNLDDLTLGQVKQLQSMLGSTTTQHPFIGKYCICRCYSAGVHAGEVVSVDGENVMLKNSRRLWTWKAKEGIALSGVAQTGINGDCKIDVVNPEHYLTGVCEIIPTSQSAMESINAYK